MSISSTTQTYHNNTDLKSKATWRAELSLVYAKDTAWRNNIGVANPGQGVLEWNRAILIARSEDMVWERNITYDGTAGNASINFSGTSVTLSDLSDNLLGMRPTATGSVEWTFWPSRGQPRY